MDGRHFDRLTKDLATSSNRRRLLRGLTAGVAGVVGLARGATVTEAAPNECAVACAGQPGARGAACRQACKKCGSLQNVCGNYVTGQYECCARQGCCADCDRFTCRQFCCPSGQFCASNYPGICCPESQGSCYNCTTGRVECGPRDQVGCCVGTRIV